MGWVKVIKGNPNPTPREKPTRGLSDAQQRELSAIARTAKKKGKKK